MQVTLMVSDWCASCDQAEKVWREVAAERGIDLAVVGLAQPEGRALAARLKLKTIPAVLVDGSLKAIGVQTRQQALEILDAADASMDL
ncbi:MAG TPA: thioredoxin family protein [Acidiferrobacterales bacterium]